MKKNLLLFILAVVMITGCVCSIPVFAADDEEETVDYLNLGFEDLMLTKGIRNVETLTDKDLESRLSSLFVGSKIDNEADKLEDMYLVYSAYGYDMYYDRISAEVAVKNTKTGQILFTNPYDVNTGISSEAVKQKLMSQIIIKYTDMSSGNEFEMLSFVDAAIKRQVTAKRIRGGIRVEYTMGREETRKLVPRRIEKTRFEDIILSKIKDTKEKEYLAAFFTLMDLSDPTLPETARAEIRAKYEVADQMALYVIDPNIKERELLILEDTIKKYTQYSFDDMLDDHSQTMYEGTENASALFKLALEYYIDEDGLRVRLPAKGIRYDSASFTLNNMVILPYLGAGRQGNTGYTMIPDGSGALIRFEDLGVSSAAVTGKIYGQDYAFHEISGQNMETWRLPVFGVIEDYVYDESGEQILDENLVYEEEGIDDEEEDDEDEEDEAEESAAFKTESRGYVAILTEGDSLAEITSEHGGALHKYHSVYTTFYPRQKDSYMLDGVSATGANAMWTVESPRKYVGNYTLKFIMLSGEEANYTGMATKYREYLEKNGYLTKLEKDDSDIPLYIENFGVVQTTEKRFGLPVEVDTPLTTFEQSVEILQALKDKDINNINLILRGWSNGGLRTEPVSKLKVEKVLGGEKELKALNAYAKENNIGLFPSFDFTYARRGTDGSFDGFNAKEDTSKTIDNRTAGKKEYDPLYQQFDKTGLMLISPNRILPFYEKISDKYHKLGIAGISVPTLGSDINSDHNEDDPLNREDSKELIVELLQRFKNDEYEVMVNAGNSYAFKYADHIVDVPLDSSERQTTSESIPFFGMVLHGYTDFAGTAINLAGDYKYNLLKTIENGANPYFILSYDNTSNLKNTVFNEYYSVRFGTWFGEETDDEGNVTYTGGDVLETYNTLNEALKPVRNSVVVSHDYIANNVVKMIYDNGISYILNYNNNPVEVEGYELGALDFVVIK
ncbi:MAG: hypothetical protein E7588_02375 [Ruminococcaceae bacterium]|nr:hypothetical protein [Oscillospiraceae bacterium]